MNANRIITERLDALPFSRWHVGMILAIGTIWIFDGYEVSLLSLFSRYIIQERTEIEYKALVTAYQIGCIVGSLVFGVFAYCYGRRAVFLVSVFLCR
jgi:MFS family permease